MLKKGFIFNVKLWRGWVWFAFWNNVISTIPGSTIWWTENDSKFRGLVGTEAQHDDSSYWQRTVDTWMARFWNVDGPNHKTTKVCKKTLLISFIQFKVELLILRDWVWFAFWSTVISTIPGATIWWTARRTIVTNFGDPSGKRHVGGRRRDTHTVIKC